jgi:hypothetical protein
MGRIAETMSVAGQNAQTAMDRSDDQRALVWAVLAVETELGAIHETIADELARMTEILGRIHEQGEPVTLTVEGEGPQDHRIAVRAELHAIREALDTIAQQGPGVLRS